MDLIDAKDVEAESVRNTKRKYLTTDGICYGCGCINNAYYEDRCVICNCGGTSFISGKISVDLRLLIDFHIEELKATCEIHGVGIGGRAKMVADILYKIDNRVDSRVNEKLVRKIIARNKKKFWFVRDIESAVIKAKGCNIRLVKEEDMQKV
jgi:hypothetical protein